jgi:hypothetical protein
MPYIFNKSGSITTGPFFISGGDVVTLLNELHLRQNRGYESTQTSYRNFMRRP